MATIKAGLYVIHRTVGHSPNHCCRTRQVVANLRLQDGGARQGYTNSQNSADGVGSSKGKIQGQCVARVPLDTGWSFRQ